MEVNVNVSKAKAAKRKRQRLKRKEKSLEGNLNEIQEVVTTAGEVKEEVNMNKTPEKSKEEVLAERQAKKAAKMGNKAGSGSGEVKKDAKPVTSPAPAKDVPAKVQSSPKPAQSSPAPVKIAQPSPPKPLEVEKTKEQIHAEREAKKLAKAAAKKKISVDGAPTPTVTPVKPSAVTPKPPVAKTNSDADLSMKMENLQIEDETPSKKILSKAERRAIQEAQRAAKAKAIDEKKTPAKKVSETPSKKVQETPGKKLFETPMKAAAVIAKPSAVHKVKLFKHLYVDKCDYSINVNQQIHPAIIKLGLQYASDSVVGSNARCYAFLNAMKTLINDYITPPEKLFCRGLEAELVPAMEFLQNCRPFAVSMTNALKYIKLLISQEDSDDNDDDKKHRLMEKIDTYASEQIETAAIAISLKVREKISTGDVILTFGCSSLIKKTLVDACRESSMKFRVIVVDSRPDHEGREMLKSLTMLGINCTYVLINAISFIMPEVTKVLLGAHALLANGYVMSRVGTAQIALVAKSYNVPVLVCCETHKFSERVQTDAFVFNELGDPNALVINKNSGDKSEHLKDWENIPHLTPLNLRYDITPPELVTAVVTEVAILPCTSVQVILRVKPAE